MVRKVNEDTLKMVLDNWAELKKVENYEKVAGGQVMKL